MTDRARIHRLVDALPDDALVTVERTLADLLAPTVIDQAAVALARAPTDGRSARAAEERLHSFFQRFERRSLADELIAERREQACGESS